MEGTVTHQERGATFLRDAIVTIVVLLIAFAAFDDITTGNEPDFRQEYFVLVACSIWLMFVAVKLMRRHRRLRPSGRLPS